MTIHVIWGNTSNHTQVKSWRIATNVIMPRRCNRIWSESMTCPLTSLPSHSINSPTDRGNCKKWSWVIKNFFLKTLSKVPEPHHHQTPPSLPIDISSLQKPNVCSGWSKFQGNPIVFTFQKLAGAFDNFVFPSSASSLSHSIHTFTFTPFAAQTSIMKKWMYAITAMRKLWLLETKSWLSLKQPFVQNQTHNCNGTNSWQIWP